MKDEDGDIWLLGRVDDVMDVSGHRLSTTEIESALVSHPKVAVASEIGAIARPRSIMVVAELPKTRSGKIMRRLLRDVAEHRPPGDSTTLADSSVMDLITQGMKAPGSADEG